MNCQPSLVEETFARLQELEQGRFQQLGDELLPWGIPQLVGLRSYGLTPEGKTRKGVPDSFVGPSPSTCRAAVEYTTQATDLEGKLGGDYTSARRSCLSATTVVLCTNRSVKGFDLDPLLAQADADGVRLEIVDGYTMAKLLCDRQDLRKRFLGIPIGAHNITSLIEEMRERLPALLEGHIPPGDLEACIARSRVDQALSKRISTGRAGTTLVIAPAGLGKTIWSVLDAYRSSGAQPTLWTAASDLSLASPDPLGVALVHAAFGVSDPARAAELADLLRRERSLVRMYLDGLDEVRDYADVTRAVHVFRAGVLAQHTHLVLLARSGAEDALRASLGRIQPELFERLSEARIVLEPFSEEEIAMQLSRQGATAAEVRQVTAALPHELRGNPLFARRCLDLLRSGSLLGAAGSDIVGVICEHFVNDVSRRLCVDGVGPSARRVRDFLEELALAALRSGNNAVTTDAIDTIPGGDMVGDNTLVGRALQSGLLARRENDAAFKFSHALFLEHFAAKGVERHGQARWEEHLPSLATAAGRQVAARIGPFISHPTQLARALLSVDGLAACEFAANVKEPIDVDVLDPLLGLVRELIASRFPSDRARALRLLAGFGPKNRGAVKCAVSWWNALPEEKRRRWVHAGADLFLKLQVEAAAELVLFHRALLWPSGMPWYEPEFVYRVQDLPVGFQTLLQKHARRQLERTSSASARSAHPLIMLLAILRDRWLVDYLQHRMASEKMLDSEAHRALIFLNTAESIDVFAESVDAHLEALQAIDASIDASPSSEKLESSTALWHRIVIASTDVGMYPHDRLVDLVEASLESSRRDHVAFGFQWAEYLKNPVLLEAHAAALARYPESTMSLTTSMVRKLLETLPFSKIREIYDQHGAHVKRQIVRHLHEIPGPDVETFLIERLEESEHRFSAIQSLGILHAVRAGPAIRRWVVTPEAQIKWIAVEALGRLRHAPALADLVEEMRCLLMRPQPERDENLEFYLINAVGRIGGADAHSILEWGFPRSHFPERVLEALFRRQDPEAVEFAKRILSVHGAARSMLASAIAAPDLDEPHLVGRIAPAWLRDETLLEYVLAEAGDCVVRGSTDGLRNPIVAVAAFDLDRARRFLEETASRALSEGEKTGMAVDPVMEARRILGTRGHPQYSRMMIDGELTRAGTAQFVGSWTLRRLQTWPPAQVRDALLARLRDPCALSTCLLWLFQWFAEAEDRVLFEELEKNSNLAVADLAHSILSRPLGLDVVG